jgi:hypothetical protein
MKNARAQLQRLANRDTPAATGWLFGRAMAMPGDNHFERAQIR